MSIDFTKRVSTNEEFELTYLRWGYAKKIMGVELSELGTLKEGYDPNALKKIDLTLFDKFKPTVKWHAKKHYSENIAIYRGLSFEREDIESIGFYHLAIYLGLYSIANNKEKRQEWEQAFLKTNKTYPTEEQLYERDRSNLINFLKQRFSQLNRISNQKLKNIGVGYRRSVFYYAPANCASTEVSSHEEALAKGFKRVKEKELARLKKVMGNKFNYQGFLTPEGQKVVNVITYVVALLPKEDSEILQQDFLDLLAINSPERELNFHEMQPDDAVSWKTIIKPARLSNLAEKYKNSSVKTKIRMIERFLRNFSGDPKYAKEVRLAKSRLSELKRDQRT